MASSAIDLTVIGFLAVNGVLMAPVPLSLLTGLLAAAIGFALLLDAVKVLLFRHLEIA